jgi:hypothetical protein
MAHINIESHGCGGKVAVDGVEVKGVTRIAVEMEAGSQPVVTLDLAAFKNALELSDARLKIGGIEAPESVERAILAHLSEKYAPSAAKVNFGVDLAGDPEEAVKGIMHAMVREHVVGPMMKTIADSGLFASGGIVSPGVYTISGDPIEEFIPASSLGSLPTAEQMAPAVRSVVQSVAADLIRLPVREMSERYVEYQRIEDDHPTRVPLAPAGLTRLATDGERNGRMTWVPGA